MRQEYREHKRVSTLKNERVLKKKVMFKEKKKIGS